MNNFLIRNTVIVTVFLSFAFESLAQTCYEQLTDTIRATITSVQAHDTILQNQDNPHFVILDVRTPSEYNPSHIEKAINYDYYSSSFTATINSLDKNKIYLLYCGSGTRSTLAFNIMTANHFRNVYNMSGGLSSWNANLFPVVTYTEPQFTYFGDSIRTFNNTPAGTTDSTCFTLTNSANSQLSITEITGLDGTVFDVEFDTQLLLDGSFNYTFYFYYSPDDNLSDSAIATITTNGGSHLVYLYGYPELSSSFTAENTSGDIHFLSINQGIYVKTKDNTESFIELYKINGSVVLSKQCSFISTEELASGMYILRATSGSQTGVMKFVR
ncbi:MAG: hypothetical protein CVU05_04560 [Bacteroidetes bacterium HGW-Bacteroidetes-21]|jgi:rhodanese-related sulfurtransferase|nr:MAG: hypothetical protein CVU05_04560 [Bacteroidetes bacterium HGW-Bacteroidetes-21]